MIERLGGIDPLNNVQTPQRVRSSKPVSAGDSISVSAEAIAKAERYYLDQVAAETPDVRTALVEEVREKIKNPSYLNQAVFDNVADKLLDMWL
ncbi:MAG: flagellar biosynthesis anti-sigma factor FlgM [Treponema sp.]|jgi:negative regulator of flagellin synthesis FlgM|nr:flagellar biosynthesis anti-sigma factor FlgM [Treponema sp.]